MELELKILNQNNVEATYKKGVHTLEEKDTLLNQILAKKELPPETYLEFSNNRLALADAFQLKVNVKSIGSFVFFFNGEGIDKQEIINKVLALKEIEVTSLEEAKNKKEALYAALSTYNHLFVVYFANGEFALSKEDFSNDGFVFFGEKKIEEKKENVEEVIKEKEEKTPSNKVVDFFSPLAKEKVHFIFALVASFLISFTISIGIYNAYAQKMIMLFFFACSLVGFVLSIFIFLDFFKSYKFLSKEYVLSFITELVGIGIGIIGFFIFYSGQQEKPEALASPKPLLIYTILASIALILISAIVGYLSKKLSNKDEEE